MRKYIFTCTLLVLFNSAFLCAQVGINTQSPYGILHIDGGGDNPPSGVPGTIQVANDIVVEAQGNMGVGTLTPTARLHLKSSVPGSAFRLLDGTEDENRILLGDQNGYAWWGITKGLGGYMIHLQKSAVSYTYNAPKPFLLNTYNNQISIPNDGSYAIMVRYNAMLVKSGMSVSDVTTQRSRQVNIKYELVRKRTGVADAVVQSVNTRPFMQIFDYSTLYLSLIAVDLKKDDTITIRITFTGNTDSDSSSLYVLLDYNNPYVLNRSAFDSSAVIFYQL